MEIPDRFEVAPNGYMLRCKLCGAQGYPHDLGENSYYNVAGRSWMHTHLREHDPCAGGCGKLLVRYKGGGRRVYHKNCPGPNGKDVS